jgi:hypothetical protein
MILRRLAAMTLSAFHSMLDITVTDCLQWAKRFSGTATSVKELIDANEGFIG